MAAEDDDVIAQLAVMCPEHNVAVISNIVRQIKSSGVTGGNNEILFNLCLDRVLFGNYAVPPPPLPPPAKKTKPNEPQFLPQFPIPGPSYNDRLLRIVESVACTSGQSEINDLTRQSTIGQEGTGNGPPIKLAEIDPNKIGLIDAAELDRYVNHVKDMFPSIEKRWINDQFSKKICLTMIVEQIVNRPGDVPKEKKPEKKSGDVKKSSPPKQNEKNYFKDFFHEKPDRFYVKWASNLLLDEFRLLSYKSLIVVMAYFNHRYAPTLKFLRNSLDGVSNRSIRGQVFPVNLTGNGAGDAVVNMQMNMSQRSRKYNFNNLHIPEELKLEVEWIKEHTADIIDTNIECHESFSTPESMNIAALERQQKLAEARELGEVYECAICCDELLIYEMVPCTDGHLFCTECLRNHAREIVFGQAKAAVTCLESECKVGFSRETLQKALDAEWMQKLEERQFEEDVNCANIEGLIRCKYCNYAVVMDAPIEQNKVFKCGNSECERAVCRLCGADWEEHLGLRCEELENSDETKFRRETEEKMAEAVIRRCHNCKAQLIKSDGCNKMTCRCGAKMCYICRKPDIDYNHFCTHVRNPGHPCDKCKSCSLWEDANKVDKEKIDEIKKSIDIDQESLGMGQKRKIGVDDTKFSPPQPAPVRNPFPGAGIAYGFQGLHAQIQAHIQGFHAQMQGLQNHYYQGLPAHLQPPPPFYPLPPPPPPPPGNGPRFQ